LKTYKLTLPDSIGASKSGFDPKEFILVQHYKDDLFTAGFCAKVLGIRKYDFQSAVLSKYGVCYFMEK
jgi:hypothetical protein